MASKQRETRHQLRRVRSHTRERSSPAVSLASNLALERTRVRVDEQNKRRRAKKRNIAHSRAHQRAPLVCWANNHVERRSARCAHSPPPLATRHQQTHSGRDPTNERPNASRSSGARKKARESVGDVGDRRSWRPAAQLARARVSRVHAVAVALMQAKKKSRRRLVACVLSRLLIGCAPQTSVVIDWFLDDDAHRRHRLATRAAATISTRGSRRMNSPTSSPPLATHTYPHASSSSLSPRRCRRDSPPPLARQPVCTSLRLTAARRHRVVARARSLSSSSPLAGSKNCRRAVDAKEKKITTRQRSPTLIDAHQQSACRRL